MPDTQILKIPMLTTLAMCVVLAGSKIALGLPAQLVVFLFVSFSIVSLLFWAGKFRQNIRFTTVLQLIAVWCLPVALLLLTVKKIDRSGWLWFKLTGYDAIFVEKHGDAVDRPVEAFLREHEAFVLQRNGVDAIILPGGEHEIEQSVIVPKGTQLIIEPGAVLRFGAGRSLISYSPIRAIGTSDAPIRFVAKNSLFKWGVVGLVQTDKSLFKHVRFEHARQARVNGMDFLAGLTALETDIEISDSFFLNMFGKDAVNVRHANALVYNTRFENAFKDGLDMDGGSGEIRKNTFIDCGDEGIDLSDNFAVRVYGNTIRDPRGGKIEADNNLPEIRAANSFGYSVH